MAEDPNGNIVYSNVASKERIESLCKLASDVHTDGLLLHLKRELKDVREYIQVLQRAGVASKERIERMLYNPRYPPILECCI